MLRASLSETSGITAYMYSMLSHTCRHTYEWSFIPSSADYDQRGQLYTVATRSVSVFVSEVCTCEDTNNCIKIKPYCCQIQRNMRWDVSQVSVFLYYLVCHRQKQPARFLVLFRCFDATVTVIMLIFVNMILCSPLFHYSCIFSFKYRISHRRQYCIRGRSQFSTFSYSYREY